MGVVRNASIIYQSIPENFIVPGETTRYVDTDKIDLDNVSLQGGFLIKILVLSSDPYMRGRMRDESIEMYSPPFIAGQIVDNFGIALVLRSEDSNFQAGDHLYGVFKFQEYTVCHMGRSLLGELGEYTKVEKYPSLPWSLYVGILGMPGQTAYMGWKAHVEQKALTAKTLFVSAGAGPVGSFVIQIAKLTNPKLRIIASAGSSEKVEFIKSIGADVAFNYKEQNTESVLDSEKPIDIYWDNVGGVTLDAALGHMAHFGLIVACGAISGYNGDKPGIKNFTEFYARAIKVQGFIISDFWHEYMTQFFAEVPAMVAESKIKHREHRYHGLENAEQALLDVQTGGNTGKAVIIVAEE